MASPPPFRKCPICGERLQFKPVHRDNPRKLMRPTEYEQLPHKCPLGAVDSLKKRLKVFNG